MCGNSLFFLFARYVLQDALGKEGEHQIGAEALFPEFLIVSFVCPEPVLANHGVSCEDSEDTAADDIVMCVCAN